MAENKTYQIKIESILGGQSPSTYFGSSNQYLSAVGIDPAQPHTEVAEDFRASGLLRPSCSQRAGLTAHIPMWMISQPKSSDIYIYDAVGSVYSSSDANNWNSISGLGDLTDGGTARGNGAAYYDNYIYFARDTTIARYGPLDGTAAFTDDYWVSTLSKTALSNLLGSYPASFWTGWYTPNHILHRHSDGKLYIADVVGNQGTIHYISTTKTTVEGDTDNGSTYSKLQVGYGLWPTAIESYGSDLVVAFFEGNGTQSNTNIRAKIAFWDTTSQNVNKITWVEFPDTVVFALRNVNGVLYAFSGANNAIGTRISRFVGGYTFTEVAYLQSVSPPFPGAVDGEANRVIFGTALFDDTAQSFYDTNDDAAGVVMSFGLQEAGLGLGIHTILGATQSAVAVTSLARTGTRYNLAFNLPMIGWSTGVGGGDGNNGVDVPTQERGEVYGNSPVVWRSQIFKIGQPFKIKKLRLPLATSIGSNTTIIPKIYFDDNFSHSSATTLATINNSNYPGKKNIVLRPDNAAGEHNFFLELKWTGSALCVVNLPITIEYELIDD